MKIILCVGIIIMTTIISKILAEKFIQRENFFIELVEFIKEVERNIRLLKEPIGKIEKKVNGFVEKLLVDVNYVDQMNILSPKEREKIKNFFHTFGRNDSVLEEKRVQSFLQDLIEMLKVVENERAKKVPLYIKLGIIVGSFIVIILV